MITSKTHSRFMLLAVAAIATLAGCGTSPGLSEARWAITSKAPAAATRTVRLTPDTGSVQLRFEGLGAPGYKTLSTDLHPPRPTPMAPIAKVVVKLSGRAIPRPLQQTVTGADLKKPTVDVAFQRVPIGDAEMTVEAFDKAGDPVGRGTAAVRVVGGTHTRVAIDVRVDRPKPLTGGVSAVISFRPAITLR